MNKQKTIKYCTKLAKKSELHEKMTLGFRFQRLKKQVINQSPHNVFSAQAL